MEAISILVYGGKSNSAAISAVSVAGMYNLIASVVLMVNGKTVFSLNGNQLLFLYQVFTGKRPLFTDVATTAGAGSFTYQLAALLPFNDFLAYFSCLDATENPGGIREFKLIINWTAGNASCFTGGGTITDDSGPNVEVHTERLVGGELDQFNRPQPGSIGYPYRFRTVVSEQTNYVGNATKGLKVRLSPKRRYSRLIIQTLNSAGDGVDTILNSARVLNDNDEVFNITRREIQRVQVDRYNITAADQAKYFPGLYSLDFASPGMFPETDWAGSEMFLILDLAALSNATVHVISDTFVNSFNEL